MSTLTPGQEHALFERDRPAWVEYALPRLLPIMRGMGDAQLGGIWGGWERATQTALWPRLPKDIQDRLTAVRSAA